MKFNFKKVTAIASSLLVTGMTMGVAAAANFPAPFSEGTSAATGIVYGSGAASTDVAATTNINEYLRNKVKSESTGEVTGESVKFEKSSTKFHLGQGVLDIISTSITDDSPNGGLPTLLADGKYVDDDNDEFDYTQKVEMANLSLTMFEDNDYKRDVPTVGIKISSSNNVLNYTLEFTDEPLWADLGTTDLTILGKQYYVLSYVTNTTLNLLDAAESTTLEEGESTTMIVSGDTYQVSLDFVGSSTARFTVNGVSTNALSAGDTQRVSEAYIGVKSIDSQQYADGVKRVEFAIGKGKLKLVNASDIELNDNAISDLSVSFTNSAEKLQKIKITWDADDDLFVAEDSEATMPGFEAVKLTYTGITYPHEEKVTVKQSQDTTMTLEDFPLKDGPADIDILYGNNSVWTGTGKDADEQLLSSNETMMTFDGDSHQYFVASFDDGSNAESYLMRATNFKTESSVNKTTFQYYEGETGSWQTVKEDAKNADVPSRGNVEFTISYIDKDAKTVNFTKGTNVHFNRLYSKEGLKVFLPYKNTSTFNAANIGELDTASTSLQGPETFNLVFDEEDKNGNIGSGDAFNLSLGWDSSSTREAEVSDVLGEDVSFVEIESTDVFRSFMYSDLATEMLWNKPSGSQKWAEIIYHGDETYGGVYLTAPDATVGEMGSMVFKDTDKSSWQNRNVVLVGGSCINTATAEKLGGTYCDAEFTDATGVGAGEFMIASYDGFASGNIALVVAGYEAADTTKAAAMLLSSAVDTTVGKKYKGTTAMEEGSVLTSM